ncbi:MAG TPA: aminoacyl-tRNA deacylase [Gaiellaceae bacterium]|nr:aminoacyl-tRNA deacylase [Gaiellaceae bacterium]
MSTPAVRVLDAAGVRYRLLEYELDPGAESFGLEAAEKLGLPPERVFKTLVVAVDGGHLFAVVPVAERLEPKALGKRASLADPADAERITGYVKGGTSVFGGRKRLPVLLDDSALAHETIVVNGGRRGLQVELDPRDLLSVTGGRAQRLTSRG